jgi:hypothetical protein
MSVVGATFRCTNRLTGIDGQDLMGNHSGTGENSMRLTGFPTSWELRMRAPELAGVPI